MTNVYTFYRVFLLILTIYSLIKIVGKIIKYKSYYDKVPEFLQRYFLKNSKQILSKPIKANSQGILLNFMLLGVLILLNVTLFIIS